MSTTLVVPDVRRGIAEDPAVGGGNALATALDVSPDVDAPYLFAQLPICDRHGRPTTELSLAELAGLVAAWSACYAGRGVGPRDRVGIYLRDSAEVLVHFLAVVALGAIPVPVNGAIEAAIAVAHFRRTGVVGVRGDDEHAARIDAVRDPAADRFWVSAEQKCDPAGDAPGPFRHAPDDPVLICHTSGTTGVPKPVIWTHGQMMAGIRPHLTGSLDRADPVILSALPPSHASAIGYATLAMLSGVPLVIMSDLDGVSVAAAADRHRATTVVGFAATFADLALRGLGSGSLATVERWVSVGDASHHAHVAELVRRGRHWHGDKVHAGSVFIDGFGSSELGFGGVLLKATIDGMTSPPRCLGAAQPFADVTVLREDGTPADPHEIGLLAARGQAVSPGYWNDSDLTYRNRRGGYWLTGDLAYRDEARRFYHVDRVVDAITTPAGVVYSVLTEEILLAGIPELADCAVVAAGQDGRRARVLARMRSGAGVDGLLARANDLLASHGRPPVAAVEAVDDDSIPVGVTGKVLKRRLRDRYASAEAARS